MNDLQIQPVCTIAPTGTALVYSPTSKTVASGVHRMQTGVTGDLLLRQELFVRTRVSSVNQNDGTVVKQTGTVKLIVPWLDTTTGKYIYNTIEVKLACDPRIGITGMDDIRQLGAQIVLATGFDEIYHNASLG